MSKLEDKISRTTVNSAVKNAQLQTKEKTDENEKTSKNIMIYNVPIYLVETIKENGISFSSYAKMAIIEKMKRDGLI